MDRDEGRTGGRVSLQEAADRLGVHYMTAYRYVRTGRLPAARHGARWTVAETDLAALQAAAAEPAERGRGRSRDRTPDLVRRLVAGDEPGAWAVVEAALAGGMSPSEAHLGLIAPAMAMIGDGWSDGRYSVGDEHRATAVAQRLVGRLGPHFSRRGPRRGTVLVGAVAGEQHGLPSAILADLLRGRGFEVVDLGANTPGASFVDAAEEADRLRVVALGAHGADRIDQVIATVRLLRHAGVGVPILVGGRGIPSADEALLAGADGWTGADGAAAVEAIAAAAGHADEPDDEVLR